MKQITAILSMLHERATTNSATRNFRAHPVLQWTLDRLAQSKNLDESLILCWDDQASAAAKMARDDKTEIKSQGARVAMPFIDSISAARKFSDGWRGGLLGSCEFDLGFHPQIVRDLANERNSDAVILIDPAAGLIDPKLVDAMINHAASYADHEFFFYQAAPGLTGLFLRPSILDRLAKSNVNPGRLLSYMPDQPARDMIATDAAVPIATQVSRSLHRFKLDSDRQIERLTQAMQPLNGQLISSGAGDLVSRMNTTQHIDALPRDVVLELNTNRISNPIFWPGERLNIHRAPLSIELAEALIPQIAQADDVRLTLAGVGDPLEGPNLFEIISLAKQNGIDAIHVETDLLTADVSRVEKLATAGVDVISIHIPGATAKTYAGMMGVDGLAKAVENMRALVAAAKENKSGLPLIVPIFIKAEINLVEMEAWYDHWLRTFGHAVIVGPSNFGGRIPDVGVADMSPPRRTACGRLNSRLTILSDGRVVSCEEDVLGEQSLGRIDETSIADIWQSRFAKLREDHACGRWSDRPVCAGCKSWHRP